MKIGNLEVVDLRSTLPKTGTYALRRAEDIQAIIIHHSGVDIDSTPEQIAAYHISLGWPGIGYHFVIRRDGTIYYCNDWSRISYHIAKLNWKYLGICLTGNFMKSYPTAQQLSSCYDLVSNLQLAFGKWYQVLGHKEAAIEPTLCPGDIFNDWKFKIESNHPSIDWEGIARSLQSKIDQAKTILG